MGAFLAWKSRFCDQRAANSPSAKCSTWENAAQTALEKCRGGILRHKRGCGQLLGQRPTPPAPTASCGCLSYRRRSCRPPGRPLDGRSSRAAIHPSSSSMKASPPSIPTSPARGRTRSSGCRRTSQAALSGLVPCATSTRSLVAPAYGLPPGPAVVAAAVGVRDGRPPRSVAHAISRDDSVRRASGLVPTAPADGLAVEQVDDGRQVHRRSRRRPSSGRRNSVTSLTHASLGRPAEKSWVPSALSSRLGAGASISPA